MKRIVVVGASGRTGRLIVEKALESGYEVTAFVRDSSRVTIKNPQLRIGEGDARNAKDLERAFAQQDIAISVIGSSRKNPDYTLIQTSTAAIVSAAKAAHIKRVIMVSSFLVATNHLGRGTKLLSSVLLGRSIADYRVGETALRSSPLDWAIVYATKLTNGPSTGITRIVQGDKRLSLLSQITRGDVADFIVQNMTKEVCRRKAIIITG